MIHRGTKEIHTKRLLLRRFKQSDAEEMFQNWTNDADVTKYLNWEPHGEVAVTRELLSLWEKEYENENCYNWGIVFENHLVGSIGLLNPNDEKCEAEAGYCMSKAYWGKGIMAEALKAVLDYSLQEVGFKRIHAKHNVENPNSGKVMIKCGMHFIERKDAPLALDPNKIVLCDCYEIV